MKDLISREAAHNMVFNLRRFAWQNPQRTEYRTTVDCDDVQFGLDEIPAVDAVEVKHGRWVEHHNYFQGFYESTDYKCSVCGLERDWLGGASFCPNCGARMDLES